jgi:hypothetical protein
MSGPLFIYGYRIRGAGATTILSPPRARKLSAGGHIRLAPSSAAVHRAMTGAHRACPAVPEFAISSPLSKGMVQRTVSVYTIRRNKSVKCIYKYLWPKPTTGCRATLLLALRLIPARGRSVRGDDDHDKERAPAVQA